MSFGALFTLRPRARKTRPGAADEPFPATEGWNERRQRVAGEQPGPGTPKRRAADKSKQGPGPR